MQVVKNIKLAPSPEWMQKDLQLEVRPINNLVDITNYVMEEYGRQCYDLDTIAGNEIIVRRARTETNLQLLTVKNGI